MLLFMSRVEKTWLFQRSDVLSLQSFTNLSWRELNTFKPFKKFIFFDLTKLLINSLVVDHYRFYNINQSKHSWILDAHICIGRQIKQNHGESNI